MFDRLTIGAWVMTTKDCPVRFVSDKQDGVATLILGEGHREFEISLDATTLAAVVRQGTRALAEISATEMRDGQPIIGDPVDPM